MSLIYLFCFINILLVFTEGNYDCPTESCSMDYDSPGIRFPFRLKGRHSEHCQGYSPAFELYCSESNDTVMELQSINGTKLSVHPVMFIVNNIDYESYSITLQQYDGCFPELLPILNLSASPFRLEKSEEYTVFNCSSTRTDPSMTPIPCLNSFNNHVYAVDTSKSLYGGWTTYTTSNYYENSLYESPSDIVDPYTSFYGPSFFRYGSQLFTYESLFVVPLFSCSKIFNTSSFSSMDLDAITLKWAKPACRNCERENKYCRLKNNGSIHDTECSPELFYYQEAPSKHRLIIKGIKIGLSTTVPVLFVAALLYYIYIYKIEEDEKRVEQFLEDYIAVRPSRYSYADLKKFTNHFKEKLGQGGYGTVYKGKLSNDIFVAVKVLDNFKGDGEEFISEVGTIGRIHHVNVVRLLGYCADGYRRGLVYEFLPNDSLQKFITSGNQIFPLGWGKLQEIVVGIAKGLDYLHQGCNQRIVHFDIKPHNILLDQNFNPKVADFGLAKLCSKEQSKVSMTAARGTIGYIAPEVFSRNYGNVTYKADIYSFGMLLLDMVGGRKNFQAAVQDDSEVYFPEWMYNQLEKGEEIAIQIENEEDNKIFKKLVVVGLWCIQWYPAGRPSLKSVIQMLEGDEIPIMPPNPFASTKSPATNSSVSRGKFFNALEIISEGE